MPTPVTSDPFFKEDFGAGQAQQIGVSAPTQNPALSQTGDDTISSILSYGTASLPFGIADTLGTSIGVLKNDDVQNTMKSMFGPGGISDFYARNRQPIRAVSDIVGLGIPGMAGMKLLKGVQYIREAGYLGDAAASSGALDYLLGSSAKLSSLENGVSDAAYSAARDGGAIAGRTMNTPALLSAKLGYYGYKVSEGIRQAAVWEGSYRALYNNSEVFFPADYTLMDQAKWGALGLVGTIGVEYAVGRYAVRKLIQYQTSAFNVGRASALADMNAYSPAQKNLANILFRPGDRGSGVTILAKQRNDTEAIIQADPNNNATVSLRADVIRLDKGLKQQVNGMAFDSAPNSPRTTLDENQTHNVISSLNKNETSLLYTTGLSNLPDSQKGFYEDFNTMAQDAKDANAKTLKANTAKFAKNPAALTDANTKANNLLQAQLDASKQIHYVVENDGRFQPYATRADNWLDTHSFDDIQRSTYRVETTKVDPDTGKFITQPRSKLTVGGDTPFELHDNFLLVKPNAKITDPEATQAPGLSKMGYSAYYAAASKLIQDWDPARAVGQQLILNENLPWRQIEGTLALGDAHPEAAKLIQYDGAFASAKDAMFHVINEKYKEYSTLMNRVENPMTTAPAAIQRMSTISPQEVIQRLNMPELGIDGQASPMTKFFAQARLEKQPDLAGMFKQPVTSLGQKTDHPLDLLSAGMQEATADNAPMKPQNFTGPLLGQKNVKPVFVNSDGAPPLSYVDQQVFSMINAKRDLQFQRLAQIDPTVAPLTSLITNRVVGNPVTNTAREVQSLWDGTLSGGGNIVGQDRIAEQNNALKAMMDLTQDTNHQITGYVSQLSKPVLEPLWGKIKKDPSKVFDANRVEHSYRYGWDVKGIDQQPNAPAKFLLNANSKVNDELWERYFPGKDISEQTKMYMPDMAIDPSKKAVVPLAVDPDSGALATEISRLSRQSGVEVNALKVALGLNPVKIRDFHLPSSALQKEGTFFVKNDIGDVINTYSEKDNAATNQRLAYAAANQLTKQTGVKHFVSSLNEVQQEAQFADDPFKVTDYSDQWAKTGAPGKGNSGQFQIDTGPESIENMIKQLHQQYLNIGARARAAVFEPELNFARQASSLTDKTPVSSPNIFDRYIAATFSRTPVDYNTGFQRVYDGLESWFDRGLSYIYGQKSALLAATQAKQDDAKGLLQQVRRKSTEQEMLQFKSQLGDWSPFQETEDFLNRTYRREPVASYKDLSAKIALVSATSSMRFLDVGTAINNMLGLVTNLPAVITSLRQLPSDLNEEAWLSRTSAWGTQYRSGIMTFSPAKAFGNTIKAWWKGELNQPMADAAAAGYVTPEWQALSKVLTDPEEGTPGKLKQFLDGASYLADHSEMWSRQITWGIGYKMGKELHQFQDERSAWLFANNFVNQTIGNYSPINKPAMFQGAIGAPLGAFQTYMFNFYRRLYGYIERGDMKSLAAQYGAQVSLFGTKSVPGFNLWNSYMTTNETGSDDQETRILRGYSPGVRELILNGSLSGIPKMFGADAPAFYSRGNIDFTNVPTLLDASKAPPIQFLQNTFDMVTHTIDNMFGAGGFSMQQQEQIMANFSTNRALKHIMEFAADAKTDRRGETVVNGTRNAINIASGLMGAEPSSTRMLMEGYSHEQAVQMTQSDLRTKLNDKVRAKIRAGGLDLQTMQDAANDYITSGGNPGYFGEWLRNQAIFSAEPKAELQMKKLFGSDKSLEFLNTLATMQTDQGD